MDSGIRVTTCKTGDRRLLDEIFESKPIKRGSKIPFRQLKKSLEFQKHPTKQTMSFLTANNNTFVTAPTSSNPCISRKLNNMEQAHIMKREREDWTRLYHKTLRGIESMIEVQRMIKDMKKIAEDMSTTVAEMEKTILTASINNRTMNATNITQIAEDLQYLIQSDMNDRALQIQRMLADELDQYKGKGNSYVEENIREIQDLYIREENREGKGRVDDKEVILVKLYEVSMKTSSSSTSFITDEVKNLLKHMKFVQMPAQTRLFKPLPYYQSLRSRGEHDLIFWKEVAIAFLEKKYNTDIVRNEYQIHMFQEGPPHKPYFIAMDNKNQIIIGPSKKIVATHVVGELEVLV